jgi:hypothetical protein
MTAPAPLGQNVIKKHIAKRAPSRHDNTVRVRNGTLFFHTRTERKMFWDRIGLDLPDFWRARDEEIADALWHEAFAKHVEMGGSLLITDESGKVVFVAAF